MPPRKDYLQGREDRFKFELLDIVKKIHNELCEEQNVAAMEYLECAAKYLESDAEGNVESETVLKLTRYEAIREVLDALDELGFFCFPWRFIDRNYIETLKEETEEEFDARVRKDAVMMRRYI